MKILYVYDRIPGIYQQYLLKLLNAIKQKLNVKTLVYEQSGESDYKVNTRGFYDRLHRIGYRLKLLRSSSIDLKIMQRFDIIHLQHSFLWKKLRPLLKQKDRPKLVITLRGGDTYLKPWSYFTFRQFLEGYFGEIDAFVVMSEHQRNYLKRWGVRNDQIYTIPISFGTTSSAKPKYPNESVLKLISAFRMTWEKNIEGTVQFAKKLKESGVSFIYDIYGGGHDLDQLYYFVNLHDLEDVVNIKRKIKNEELIRILPDYDFMVQLSFTESLGMSVIEAQSLGLPCIVSDSDGQAEVVRADETAIVAHYSELDYLVAECINLWKDKERYFEFSSKAIDFVNSDFSLEKETERLERMYEELMKS